jgi:antitoxin YefM
VRVTTSSDLRANMESILDAIENDAEDLVVARSGREPLVVMLKSDYDAWRETEYLSGGANGRELRRRVVEMETGSRIEHELVEIDTEVAG